MASHEALLQYAADHGGVVTLRWGRIEVRLATVDDLQELRNFVAAEGLEATAAFGQQMSELRLSAATPSDDEINDVRSLSDDPSKVAALETAGSGWAAADAIRDHLAEVTVIYEQPNWCLSQAVLESELEQHWISVSRKIRSGTVTVGDIAVEVTAAVSTDARFPMLLPVGDPPSDDVASVWLQLAHLADAQAWRNIATEEAVIDDKTVRVALHRDQLTVIPVSPANSRDGFHLWSWLTKTADGNREEAVRHVLRLLTATGEPTLPDGTACASLAERHRIALGRDHAAEVERAIADSRQRTAERVEAARSGLAAYIEDTTKTAQGALVASIGVVALGLQQSALVPYWLLLTTTAAASFGVVTLVAGRRRRIADLIRAVDSTRGELDSGQDPLLPDSERSALLRRLDDFNTLHERRRAQRMVSATGIAAVAIMWSATAWLGLRDNKPAGFSDVIAVTGYYRAEGGVARLCESLGSGDPPSCDDSVAVLQGVDQAELPPLRIDQGVEWSDNSVLVVGALDGEVLVVTSVSEA